MNWYLEALRKYTVFQGRARRREYWYFTLFNFLAVVVLTIIDMTLGTFSMDAEVGLLSGIYSLGVLIPSIAVAVRRLHDTDRSGWWLLLCFIPILGVILLIVFLVLDGTPGPNRFGANPKEGASAAA